MKMHYILTVAKNNGHVDGYPVSRQDTYVGTMEAEHSNSEAEVLAEIFATRVGIPLVEAREYTITFYRLVPDAIVVE